MLREAAGEDSLIADRAVCQDQHRAGVAAGDVDQAGRERWQAAPGVNQDRNADALGECEDRVHLTAVEHEVLRSRMQLDPSRAGREAAFALGKRSFRWVQPTERDEPAVALAGPGKDTVVGRAV